MAVNLRHQLARDVMIGMAKCPVTMEERWVDECTHEGGKKLLPSRNITPLIEHLIEQGWTKDVKECICYSTADSRCSIHGN